VQDLRAQNYSEALDNFGRVDPQDELYDRANGYVNDINENLKAKVKAQQQEQKRNEEAEDKREHIEDEQRREEQRKEDAERINYNKNREFAYKLFNEMGILFGSEFMTDFYVSYIPRYLSFFSEERKTVNNLRNNATVTDKALDAYKRDVLRYYDNNMDALSKAYNASPDGTTVPSDFRWRLTDYIKKQAQWISINTQLIVKKYDLSNYSAPK